MLYRLKERALRPRRQEMEGRIAVGEKGARGGGGIVGFFLCCRERERENE